MKRGLIRRLFDPVSSGSIPVLIAFLLAALVSGCATHKAAITELRPPALQVVGSPEGSLPAEFWDAYTIFESGNALFANEHYAGALSRYELLFDQHPDSEVVPLARYNAALSLERLGRFGEALGRYRALLSEGLPNSTTIDLHFRAGACLEGLEQWSDAAQTFARIASMPELDSMRRAEAFARKAVALFYSGEDAVAERALRAALAEYKSLERRGVPFAPYHSARTVFVLGELYFERFEDVSLEGTESEQEAALEAKADLFLLTRAQYVKAIRTYSAEWMTASLHRIGEAYEHFWQSVLEAPVPDDINEQEVQAYRAALARVMEPVRRKAMSAFGRNLKLASDLDLDDEWVQASREHLAALRDKE